MKAIFDVGADDGMNGILFAFKNPKIKVFSFEPIRGSKKKIKANLKKVSTFFDIKIKNYEIINTAVSNYNGYTTFYETHYKVASSLLEPKQKKKLDKFWTQTKDLLKQTEIKGLKTKKSYKVKVIKSCLMSSNVRHSYRLSQDALFAKSRVHICRYNEQRKYSC